MLNTTVTNKVFLALIECCRTNRNKLMKQTKTLIAIIIVALAEKTNAQMREY